MKINNINIISSWLWLIILTFASVFVGYIIDESSVFIVIVMFIVFLKGQQIVDVFMELQHAPKKWRLLLLSYVILLPSIIALIYIL